MKLPLVPYGQRHNVILLDPADPNSIAAALSEYRQLLDCNDVLFGDCYPHLDVEFKVLQAGNIRRLQVSDAPLLNEQTFAGMYTDTYDEQLNTVLDYASWQQAYIEDGDEIFISEIILFALAIGLPQLEADVVATAESMIAFARRLNDSGDMWRDSETIFGIDALFLLAWHKPKYSYLLSRFIIPEWDIQLLQYYLCFLHALLARESWSADLVKAYVYCDNPAARLGFYCSYDSCLDEPVLPSLGEYLQQHPEQYQSFVAQVKSRFSEQAMLIDADCEQGFNAVLSLFQTLVFPNADQWDEQEAGLVMPIVDATPFMGSSLGEQAAQLKSELQTELLTVQPATALTLTYSRSARSAFRRECLDKGQARQQLLGEPRVSPGFANAQEEQDFYDDL
ncbi:hypothetical protein [Shewanella halifaxensis]|uniref:hypothetical protein n=1 Tax=Shewanella halifaxensis TaxID=271098 RepID=UPI000D59B568|nr:hypothetical protein [Shewanella halifaxensis]